MKKLCLIIAALVLSTGAFAQKKWVGGATSISAASGVAAFEFSPEFGYFVTDDISVEVGLGFGFASSINAFATNVTGRYWVPVTDNLTYTPGLGLGFTHGSADVGIATVKSSVFDVNFYLGAFNYAINDRWAVGANFCSLKLGNIFDHFTPSFGLSSSTVVMVRYCF